MSVGAATMAGSLKRGVALLVASLLLGLATAAPPALAAQTHVFQGAIGVGDLTSPAGLAVDGASGDLYVADPGTSTVHRFDADGAPAPFTSSGTDELGPFTFPIGSEQVAVDNSTDGADPAAGHLYVIDGDTVKAFDSDGEPASFTATAGYLTGNEITGTPAAPFEAATAVAVDKEGDLYVVDSSASAVRVYAPSGEYLTSIENVFLASVAVPDSTGVTYAGSIEFLTVEAYAPTPYPVAAGTTYTPSAISFPVGAALAVDQGDNQVFASNNTSAKAPTSITQYGSFTEGNHSVVTFGARQLTAGVAGIAVSGATGASAGDVYVATGSQVDRFGPLATIPDVVTDGATAIDPATGSATLNGTLDPNGIQLTNCEFEYGPTLAYGQSVECVPGPSQIGAGVRPVSVTARLNGLAPGNYHFRLVAANANGPAEPSADATFTTTPEVVRTDCPNEALRVGPSALLPECRAYEMVSPVDKNGGGVLAIDNAQAVASGDAIEYLSTNSFAGAPANVLNAYIARREGGDWNTTGIDARQFNPDSFIEITSFATSEDLTKSLQFSFVALTPGAIGGGMNLYEHDNLTGERTLIAAESRNFRGQKLEELISRSSTHYVGGTSNWSRVYFTVAAALTPGAEAGVQNIYEFSNGKLSLVEVPPTGSEPAQPAAGIATTPDGKTIFFQSRAGYAYVSVKGASPKLITASQRSGEVGQPVVPQTIVYSKNGAFAFFVSGVPLTDDAATESRGSLYRYDVSSGVLTDLTPTESPVVTAINQVSEDGSRAVVTADGALTTGSIPAQETVNFNVFAWHEGEGFSEIGEPDPSSREGTLFEQLQMSPDGRYVAIGTFLALTSADVPSPSCPTNPSFFNPPGACRDIYVYDAVEKTFTCVSCNGLGAGFSKLPAAENSVFTGLPVHSVLDDGSVFFNSPNKLVPRDTNGVQDVYRYRNGNTTLISTGTDPDDSIFSEATPSGHDVFFRTAQRLVGQDVDSRIDLYDARVDGGIASQNPPGSAAPCEGDACKGVGTSPPPPLGGKVEAIPDLCKTTSDRAAKARKMATQLANQAKKAKGKHARSLRKKAGRERGKARKLTKQTTQCRRQGK